MTKVFSKALMASEDVQSYVISTKFTKAAQYAPVMDGAFVVLDGLDKDNTYSAESLDYNVYKSKAPEAPTTDKVVVIDIAGVEQYRSGANTVKMGNKLVDLQADAGEAVRCRRLAIGDKFWLGEGNFKSAPKENKFAILTANDVILTPAASAEAEGFTVAILTSKDLTVGQSVAKNEEAYEQAYLCEVIKL